MKNKNTIILGAVFVVLVIAYLVFYMNPKDVTRGAFPIFEVRPDVDKIEFDSVRRGNIVLERTDNTWFITHPIEKKAYDPDVNQMLKFLFETEVDGVVSSRADARDRYSVSDSTGTKLTLYSAGEEVFTAVVGKQSAEIGHTYARRNNSDDIELWRGMMSQEAIRDVNSWRDKTVFNFHGDDVVSLEAVEGKMKRELVLSDSTWSFREGGAIKEIDQNKARILLEGIANLKSDDFGSEKDSVMVSMAKPDLRISFKVRNGDTHFMDVWKPSSTTGQYIARKENDDILYRIYTERGDILILNYDIMKPGGGQPQG